MAPVELCVIFNPKAGRLRAARRLQAVRRAWGGRAEFWPTEAPGHGEELAERAARAGFRVVAAAGGDGTVHEVANGILRAGHPDVRFGVVPLGSANDYAHSLGMENGYRPPAPIESVDVGVVRDPSGRRRHFVCCLGLGLNGMVTLESRKIRRLQGLALYGLATLRALWYRYAVPHMEFTTDSECWEGGTLLMSVMLGRREGGFVMAPDARLDDGLFDYVHAGALSRWEVVRLMPRLALGGPPEGHPKIRLGRCRRLALKSEAPLVVHIDGEFFCKPEDGVRELDIELLPGALRVQTAL
jgi:diacylglycerol kinase family enzyme